jgi:hypothetical protein
VFALVTGGAAAAGIRRILNLETRFPEGTYRLVIGMNSTVPAILEGTFTLGLGEDPVIAAGDRLLIAESSGSRSRRGRASAGGVRLWNGLSRHQTAGRWRLKMPGIVLAGR